MMIYVRRLRPAPPVQAFYRTAAPHVEQLDHVEASVNLSESQKRS